MAVVGLYTIGLALNTPDLDPTLQILYLTIAVLAFTFVVLSFMRMRRGIRIGAYTALIVVSVVKCRQCSFKQITNFAFGDFVFKTVCKCTQFSTSDLMFNGI